MAKLSVTLQNDEKIRIQIAQIASRQSHQREVTAIVDTGAFVSYFGAEALKSMLGQSIELSHIEQEKHRLVPMHGITGAQHTYPRKWPKPEERIYASFPTELVTLQLGEDIQIRNPLIYIPVSFCVTEQREYDIRFERKNDAIIGMDILRSFNFGLDFDEKEYPVFYLSPRSKRYRKRGEDQKPKQISFHD